MFKNQGNVHFSFRVILLFTLPIQAPRPSMTLSYNDVSIVVVLGLPKNNIPQSPFSQRITWYLHSLIYLYTVLIYIYIKKINKCNTSTPGPVGIKVRQAKS